jgi:predicted NACHT family NTPase
MSVDPRLQLFNTLTALPPPAFNKLLFAIQPPDGVVAGPTAPQGDRTAQLLQWAESPTGHGLAFVKDVLNQLDSHADSPESPRQSQDIEALVAAIRAQVHGDIQARCGTMRVLDMEQPISLGDIYTSVNILEKLSRNQRPPKDEWLKHDPENFDRFLLGQVRHKRVPGLRAVERHSQLMILGKPGAGKTTFMKRLATLCNQGKFQPQRVPVFVTLKDYAEAEGKPTLQTYIQRQWKDCGVEEVDTLSTVLGSGKALVLLDGLDEVYETDHNRVLQDIKTFAHQFRNCQCVITCRIAAREYIFEQFTEVEVADFDKKQIAEFATKWFAAKNDLKKAETFIQRLEDNEPIQELATNPLLLTLLCLVFGEAADFPANRAELYKEGLDVLLKKWDGKRNIERDQVYKKLSLKRKEDLLSQLAFETFERGDYFFKQSTVESHVIHYIRNLPGASDDEEVLQLDSEAVLKSIEAQHGLLVERARGIYSFSHLTFQEYFTSRHLASSASSLNLTLQNWAKHISEIRYREIFLLTVSMLSKADLFLLSMKQEIDKLMVEDDSEKEPKLQSVLIWVRQKSLSIDDAVYKPEAIRAFYYGLNNTLGFALSLAVDLDCNLAVDLDRDPAPDFDLDLALSLTLDRAQSQSIDLAFALSLALERAVLIAHQKAPELERDLQRLKLSSPDKSGHEALYKWWRNTVEIWSEDLRYLMIKHRNIGHDWQFSRAQARKLQQYYYSNKLLIDCLNSDCYVTKATRQYIEDTLLLPLSEIEKYPVPDAIANL